MSPFGGGNPFVTPKASALARLSYAPNRVSPSKDWLAPISSGDNLTLPSNSRQPNHACADAGTLFAGLVQDRPSPAYSAPFNLRGKLIRPHPIISTPPPNLAKAALPSVHPELNAQEKVRPRQSPHCGTPNFKKSFAFKLIWRWNCLEFHLVKII